ncbi:MAG: putative ABC transporter permease [Faecousia sp.]
MQFLLMMAYLFFIGASAGWVLELVYRNLNKSGDKWINPGFCTGPYVPIYGVGLCVLYLLASLEQYHFFSNPLWNKAALFVAMAVCMTLIEYIAGIFCLKVLKVRLWDYSDQWGNVQGIICPAFSAAWAALGAVYYFLIHPRILKALEWLSSNLAFSFFIGVFFGVFIIDVAHSAHLTVRLKKFSEDNHMVVKYEALKAHIRSVQQKKTGKYNFFRPFQSDRPLGELLKEMLDAAEKRNSHP